MGKNIIIFVLCFVVGFGGGYLIFGTNKNQTQQSNEPEKTTEQSEKIDEEVKDDAIAQQQGDASDNVYVTGDERLSERIRNLFTNMNNVKTSNVSSGIGEIIYEIGRMNGREDHSIVGSNLR